MTAALILNRTVMNDTSGKLSIRQHDKDLFYRKALDCQVDSYPRHENNVSQDPRISKKREKWVRRCIILVTKKVDKDG